MKRENVWSRDFTLITVGTIISAIAWQTISLPLSLTVFDETGSTFLSAILLVASMIPSVILPILIAPLIDRNPKKVIIVSLDYLTGFLYLLIAYIINITGFHYYLYLFFSLFIGTIGTVYQLAFQAWFPDLIPLGFEQQGFAVSSTIYPSVMVVMSPIAAYLYKTYPLSFLFVIIGSLTIIAASFELFISNIHKGEKNKRFDFKEYKSDLLGGFAYLRKEKGIRNIYTYMSITSGIANGNTLMIQAYFQTISFLTVTMLAFLRSAETIGRIIGGVFPIQGKCSSKETFWNYKICLHFL